MAKFVSRRRMLTGRCHGFCWLQAHRERRIETAAPRPGPEITKYIFDDRGFVECLDYDQPGGRLAVWRLYRRDRPEEGMGLLGAWELIEGRVYDAEGKRLATFGKEQDAGFTTAHCSVTTYVYDGNGLLSRVYDGCSHLTTFGYFCRGGSAADTDFRS